MPEESIHASEERGRRRRTGLFRHDPPDSTRPAQAVSRHGRRRPSPDGASRETYEVYRVRGSFDQVLRHIDVINEHKRRLGRTEPILSWQFVVMGHNEHEIDKARRMAAERGMRFKPKLTWDDDFSPLRNVEAVRAALGHAPTRDAWSREHGRGFGEAACLQLWEQPQINWDGKEHLAGEFIYPVLLKTQRVESPGNPGRFTPAFVRARVIRSRLLRASGAPPRRGRGRRDRPPGCAPRARVRATGSRRGCGRAWG